MSWVFSGAPIAIINEEALHTTRLTTIQGAYMECFLDEWLGSHFQFSCLQFGKI